MQTSIAGLLLAGSWLTGTPASTDSTAEDDQSLGGLLPITSFELDNGMRFALVERPRAATVAAGWVVEAGSADDPAGLSGLAHMLEHMLFKGTGTIRTGELDLLYARAGATGLNAVTQRDLTAYFVSLPAEKLELWFWLESDRLLDAAFRDLAAERGVLREERRLRIDSSPTGVLEEELWSRAWGDHPYAQPVSGDPAHLDRIGLTEARGFFDRHYHAANLTAVLVGSFEPARVRSLAERYFGRLPDDESPRQGAPMPSALEKESTFEASCACRPQARVLYRTVGFVHPDAAGLDVLVSVLNGRSGRLHRSLVLEQELAFAAFARHEVLQDGGILSLTAEAKGDATASDLLAALDGELARLLAEPPDESELARAKIRLRAEGLRALEESSELMLRMLVHAGLGEVRHLDGWQREIAALTPADVVRAAREYVAERPRIIGLFDRSESPEAAP